MVIFGMKQYYEILRIDEDENSNNWVINLREVVNA